MSLGGQRSMNFSKVTPLWREKPSSVKSIRCSQVTTAKKFCISFFSLSLYLPPPPTFPSPLKSSNLTKNIFRIVRVQMLFYFLFYFFLQADFLKIKIVLKNFFFFKVNLRRREIRRSRFSNDVRFPGNWNHTKKKKKEKIFTPDSPYNPGKDECRHLFFFFVFSHINLPQAFFRFMTSRNQNYSN